MASVALQSGIGDEALLADWLGRHVAGFREPMSLDRLAGGQSNPTYRITTPDAAYVLRRKPLGPLLASAHAVDREYRVLAALYPTGFPVPEPLVLCEDARVLGSAFYVMRLVPGRTLWEGSLPGFAPSERTAIYHAMTDTLAALHRVDPDAVGLAHYGKDGAYLERQVARWTHQYRASQTATVPELERLIEWLPQTCPAQQKSVIVHGDYRIDNLLFAPDSARIAAVIDWELSTLGDPIADLSYLLLNWVPGRATRSAVAHLDQAALGIPSMRDMADRYFVASGLEDRGQLDWYFAFNFFRLACIVQGIAKRIADGTAANSEALTAAASLPRLAQSAWAAAQAAGA